MKKLIKKRIAKGFTLTELVIVIVIIAIMAAILIPTYTGYVQKVKLSNDQQTVVNINKFLLHASVDTPEQIDTLEEVQKFITTKGYSNPLSTSSADSEFGVYISGTAGFDDFIVRIYLADATYGEYGFITSLKASYFEDGSDNNITLDVINAKIESDYNNNNIAYDKMCLSYTIKSVINKKTLRLIDKGVTASDGKTTYKFEGDTLVNKTDHYTLTKSSDSKTITLSEAGDSTGDFVIPDGVTNVDSYAFCDVNKTSQGGYPLVTVNGSSSITSVKIPDSVTIIGMNAFYNCDKLATVTMSDSVTWIGNNAFKGCTSLKEIDIPQSVTSISNNAFQGCTSLEEIDIPESVTSIGGSAFQECTSLKEIDIPESVTSIGASAFQGCTSLKEIDIPRSVDKVNSNAFQGCTALTKITVDAKVIYQAFYDCTSLTEVNLGDNVQTIDIEAFYNCTALTTVSLSANITSIGTSAFENCTSLKNITIPSSVITIGNEAFANCTSLTEIVIPDSVTSIGASTFKGCTILTKADIGKGVKTLFETFRGCTNLTTVSIANGVEEIGDYTFYQCKSLTEIVIPDSVTLIKMLVCDYCSKLETLTIGKGVKTLQNYLITQDCGNLTTINYTGTSTEWQKVYKADDWNSSKVKTVHCSDGDVTC